MVDKTIEVSKDGVSWVSLPKVKCLDISITFYGYGFNVLTICNLFVNVAKSRNEAEIHQESHQEAGKIRHALYESVYGSYQWFATKRMRLYRATTSRGGTC